jgi:3'-phosphoadenosine 5'-phosphosulfate sulfotransferase (PAPS reductase)/FAD synthetase
MPSEGHRCSFELKTLTDGGKKCEMGKRKKERKRERKKERKEVSSQERIEIIPLLNFTDLLPQ